MLDEGTSKAWQEIHKEEALQQSIAPTERRHKELGVKIQRMKSNWKEVRERKRVDQFETRYECRGKWEGVSRLWIWNFLSFRVKERSRELLFTIHWQDEDLYPCFAVSHTHSYAIEIL